MIVEIDHPVMIRKYKQQNGENPQSIVKRRLPNLHRLRKANAAAIASAQAASSCTVNALPAGEFVPKGAIVWDVKTIL